MRRASRTLRAWRTPRVLRVRRQPLGRARAGCRRSRPGGSRPGPGTAVAAGGGGASGRQTRRYVTRARHGRGGRAPHRRAGAPRPWRPWHRHDRFPCARVPAVGRPACCGRPATPCLRRVRPRTTAGGGAPRAQSGSPPHRRPQPEAADRAVGDRRAAGDRPAPGCRESRAREAGAPGAGGREAGGCSAACAREVGGQGAGGYRAAGDPEACAREAGGQAACAPGACDREACDREAGGCPEACAPEACGREACAPGAYDREAGDREAGGCRVACDLAACGRVTGGVRQGWRRCCRKRG